MLLNVKWVLIFLCKLFPKYFSFGKEISEELTKIYTHLYVKYPFCFLYFNKNLIFLLPGFRKISTFVKIRPVGSRLVTCGRTDTNDGALTAAFRNLQKASETCRRSARSPLPEPIFSRTSAALASTPYVKQPLMEEIRRHAQSASVRLFLTYCH
jgi:hypothetical protein